MCIFMYIFMYIFRYSHTTATANTSANAAHYGPSTQRTLKLAHNILLYQIWYTTHTGVSYSHLPRIVYEYDIYVYMPSHVAAVYLWVIKWACKCRVLQTINAGSMSYHQSAIHTEKK
eukprot:Tbor_TRINITY_DN5570_c3_g4::TRINITY_DN5570_c3_g4_i1::g.13898::m.13898